jgi:uncharacterized protein (DUF885 family)
LNDELAPIQRRTLLAAGTAAALSAAGCAAPGPAVGSADESFARWADGFAEDWMRLQPEQASASQYFGRSEEQAALDRQLSSQTRAERARRTALARQGQAALAGFAPAALTPARAVEAATIGWALARVVAGEPFEGHQFPFSQTGGLHLRANALLSQSHPMRRPQDVDSWLARLALLPQRCDEAVQRTREAAASGVLPPRFILERSRAQIAALLAPASADNVFVMALATRSARIESLAPEQRTRALADAQALVERAVKPAFARALALLDELHPKTTTDAGLWRLPDGEAAYAHALATNTTTTMSAREIHELGLREVARIEAEMDRLLQAMGRSAGSVNARTDALRLELQPPPEPDPRPALLARYAEYIRDAERRSAPLFKSRPKALIEVRRVAPLGEASASASYAAPAPDGSRPGVFWVPLPGPVFNIPTMRTLAVHEAVPGHHFQIALQQEQMTLPRWKRERLFGGGSAFSEGWALYAERLAIEENWYEGDPVSLLGAWNALLFRARRLVVDTGLHAFRWTRQQAIDYGISVSEVERYVSNPGQACAYMVGMLRIHALREAARAAMGSRFSLPDFHECVLGSGSVPLDVLAGEVRRWSAGALQRP